MSSYSRKQALEDGVLIDVTQQAKASGFKLPTAIGDNLYHQYITPPDGLEGDGQSLEGRLHDVFEMLTCVLIFSMNHPTILPREGGCKWALVDKPNARTPCGSAAI